jgi:hypothetical protein
MDWRGGSDEDDETEDGAMPFMYDYGDGDLTDIKDLELALPVFEYAVAHCLSRG